MIKYNFEVSTLWNSAGIARLVYHAAPRQAAVKGGAAVA